MAIFKDEKYTFDDEYDEIIILPENYKKIMKYVGANGGFKSKSYTAGQVLHQALNWFNLNITNNISSDKSERGGKGTYVPFALPRVDYLNIIKLSKRAGVVNIILEMFFLAVDNGEVEVKIVE